MTAGQLAALIAAVFFAVLACAGVVVLVKLARLMSAATRLMSDYSGRADVLLERAQAAVDRTNEQLARTDSITASMDQVTANMAELSGHVSALAGLARTVSAAAAMPVTGLSALVYGVRQAVLVRRSVQAAVRSDSARRPAVRLADSAVHESPPRAALTGAPASEPPGSVPTASGPRASGPRASWPPGQDGGPAVIRRGFWLTAGAVLGVTGYRRVTRLARGLTGGTLTTGTPGGRTLPRAGGSAPDGQAGAAGTGHPVRPRSASTLSRILAVVRFARDVRAGMAEYLDLHHRELARTLGSRSRRASSG